MSNLKTGVRARQASLHYIIVQVVNAGSDVSFSTSLSAVRRLFH